MTGHQRWYVEESDWEMDLWVKVSKNQDSRRGEPGQKPLRKLRIIVTVFKKSCKDGDMWYRRCKGTNHCVRQGYFCDTLANCVWPSGEDAADEKDCKVFQGSPLEGGPNDKAQGTTSYLKTGFVRVIFEALV